MCTCKGKLKGFGDHEEEVEQKNLLPESRISDMVKVDARHFKLKLSLSCLCFLIGYEA